jgi:hypothetical protein
MWWMYVSVMLICPRLFYWLMWHCVRPLDRLHFTLEHSPPQQPPRWLYRFAGYALTVIVMIAVYDAHSFVMPSHPSHSALTTVQFVQLPQCDDHSDDDEYCVVDALTKWRPYRSLDFFVTTQEQLYFTVQHMGLQSESLLIERLQNLSLQGVNCICASQLGLGDAIVHFVFLQSRWSVLYNAAKKNSLPTGQLMALTQARGLHEVWIDFDTPLIRASETQRLLMNHYTVNVPSHTTVLRRVRHRERLSMMLSGQDNVRCFSHCSHLSSVSP